MDPHKRLEREFFTEYGEAGRYQVHEVVGKGSYGVVGSATDTHTGEKVAIKKINDVFEHVSDATRILREVKLLRLLRHPDIVEIRHIMLPPSRREFRDIYVVFELMESDLHQVIRANDDLTPEHHQFFLYQLLRGLKYIHSANVYHRDLKPKNILANADCKLKICDFGLARVSFNDAPTAVFWTDYVATRWYRAPELCGSFFSKYTPAIDIWSIGCIFAEMLMGKPLFPGKNVVHQLDLMTDLLGTPPPETIARIRNEKARRYLNNMRKKQPVPFTQKFPNVDPLALKLLERLLAFDPKDRPSAEESLADPYFNGLSNVDREPCTQAIPKLEFEFERRKLGKDDVRELIYREILEYHPQMLQEYLRGGEQTSFLYPSGVDRFKRQFAHLEEGLGKGGNGKTTPLLRHHASLPRERVPAPKEDGDSQENDTEKETSDSVEDPENSNETVKGYYTARSLLKSASISASKCIGGNGTRPTELEREFFTEYGEAGRYQVHEVVGKGSYGVVGSATDTHTGEKVAIKKINDVFEHVSDATRILREVKLLRLLRHPDIVEIRHIMLPPSRREFRDIYVVFELMESDLHQVIRANDDLTPEHHQFFLYQLLRGLKYIHSANVYHRDLKPKNILANADCKLKICDFGLARVSFNDAPTAVFWTDYVATRWYRAPELCGSFFSKYTPAIDIWSIGCIFAEMLMGKPLFPGKNVVHQLDLMTDLLGTPPPETIARIRNEKARRYLNNMRKKQPVPFTQKFPNVDPLALKLLERLLAFDPKDRPSAEESLADPYFNGLSNVDREPCTQAIPKLEFEFERRKLGKDDVRELIYREILEYHPQMLQEYLRGGEQTSFLYPSGVDRFKRQFAHLEEGLGKGGNGKTTPLLRHHASLPRERVPAPKEDGDSQENDSEKETSDSVEDPENSNETVKGYYTARSLLKSASISASKCIGGNGTRPTEEELDENKLYEQ